MIPPRCSRRLPPRGFRDDTLSAMADAASPAATLRDLQLLFAAQREAFASESDPPLGVRRDRLDRLLALSKERYIAAYDIALIHAALADT